MAPLRPSAWMVNLALAGAVSYSTAAVSMQALEQRLIAAAPDSIAQAPQQQEEAQAAKLTIAAFEPVLSANIFGARRSEVKPTGQPSTVTRAAPVRAAPVVPLTVTLTGTMIMGERSFAMLADGSGRNEKVYRLWDCLPAGEDHPSRKCEETQGKLMAVRRSYVLVRYHGEMVKFELAEKPKNVANAAPAKATSRREPPGKLQPEGGGEAFAITQEGNVLEVRVPNAEVAKAFENFSDVLKQARVVPYTDESGTGFQIRNIRPGSIFERIGLTNFDKIKAVNGEPITTADQALRLLTMFRNEREISLDLERKNQELQLNYIID